MGTAATIIGVAAGVVGTGASMYEESERMAAQTQAQEAQDQALRIKESEEKSAAAQQQITRDQKLQQVQATQEAMAVSRGMDLSSGTFNALSVASYNNFAEATHSANMNLQSEEDIIDSQRAAARQELHDQKWSDFFGVIGHAANIALVGSLGSKKGLSAGDTQALSDGDTSVPEANLADAKSTYTKPWDDDSDYGKWLADENQTY